MAAILYRAATMATRPWRKHLVSLLASVCKMETVKDVCSLIYTGQWGKNIELRNKAMCESFESTIFLRFSIAPGHACLSQDKHKEFPAMAGVFECSPPSPPTAPGGRIQ